MDIMIDGERVITHIPFDADEVDTVDLDQYLIDSAPIIDTLEVECVAECRGIQAFRFTPKAVRFAATNFGTATMVEGFKRAIDCICNEESDYFVSSRLNQFMQKAVVLELLEHIIDCVATSQNSG